MIAPFFEGWHSVPNMQQDAEFVQVYHWFGLLISPQKSGTPASPDAGVPLWRTDLHHSGMGQAYPLDPRSSQPFPGMSKWIHWRMSCDGTAYPFSFSDGEGVGYVDRSVPPALCGGPKTSKPVETKATVPNMLK